MTVDPPLVKLADNAKFAVDLIETSKEGIAVLIPPSVESDCLNVGFDVVVESGNKRRKAQIAFVVTTIQGRKANLEWLD